MFSLKQSYASVTHGDAISKGPQLNRENANCIQLNKKDLIKVKDTTIVVGSPLFKVDERMVWVEINGRCVHGNLMLSKKCETFEVHVKEIGTRSIHITGDLVSNDLGDRCDVEECRSLNDEVDPNDILDDFIQHLLEEKELSNVPKDVQHVEKRGECSKIDSEGSEPLRFDKVLELNKEGDSFSMNLSRMSIWLDEIKWKTKMSIRMLPFLLRFPPFAPSSADFPWDRLFLLSDRLRQETHLSILLNEDTWSYGNFGYEVSKNT
ncbi:hypothetical protein Tco_0104589 [Tanacetum coccineum]